MANGLLVIIPCGQKKVWKRNPNSGPTPAKDAYEGAPFKVNKEYAERFADRWVILSAKYGFIDPGFSIPCDYNVTFKKPSTNPVGIDALRRQVGAMGLGNFARVVGLGGKEYRQMVSEAFAPLGIMPEFPFAGMSIGKMMGAIKSCIVQVGHPARPSQ